MSEKNYEICKALVEEHEIPYITFPILTDTGLVSHCFTTREGGVSEGPFASLNMGFQEKDPKEHRAINYRLAAMAMGRSLEDMVLSQQTHTANVRVVREEDRGKCIVKERDYTDVDGLVTNVEGILLVTLHADCTPLYFLDPIKRAIGLAHSGWKGTLSRIGACTVKKMQEEYGSKPEDILAVIGPCICVSCYEVGEDLRETFTKEWGEEDIARYHVFANSTVKGKAQLDLTNANRLVLEQAGLNPLHIKEANLCTCDHPDLLFSHRAVKGGDRGNCAALLSLN